jgi:hypothetical protein
MPVKTKVFKFSLCLLAFFLCIIIIAGGCAKTTSGFQSVTLNKPGLKIAFEYPAAWEDPADSLKDTTSNVLVFLVHFPSAIEGSDADMTFQILASAPSTAIPNGKASLDSLVSSFASLGPSFKVIERSPAAIAGVQGETVVYSALFTVQAPLGAVPSICRDIYFDYQGQIWVMALNAHQDVADLAKADFDHVVQSFKLN